MAPANGMVSFHATVDDFIRFTVGGNIIMDTVTADGNQSTSLLTGELEMIQVRCQQHLDRQFYGIDVAVYSPTYFDTTLHTYMFFICRASYTQW